MECTDNEQAGNLTLSSDVVAREASELDVDDSFTTEKLSSLFRMYLKKIRKDLQINWRREPDFGLIYWKQRNSNNSVFSPVPFNKIAKACFSAQASSAAAEWLFSDLERYESRTRHSTMTSNLEMTTSIRYFMVYSSVM